MTAAAIFERAIEDGLIITLNADGGLRVIGSWAAIDRWLPVLRARKPELLQLLARQAEAQVVAAIADLREFFEERAGILEHDGGLPRPEAEAAARAATACLARNRGYPWRALREALKDLDLPDLLVPVDGLPYGVPKWTVDPQGVPVRQGSYRVEAVQ